MTDHERNRFIRYEFKVLSLHAGLATRNSKFPIYKHGIKEHNHGILKVLLRNTLTAIDNNDKYISGLVTDDQHCGMITSTAKVISETAGEILHNNRFRIGITQKFINLYLKYLWCAGIFQEPIHCPIDGIIRKKTKIDYDWQCSDDILEYSKSVDKLREFSNKSNMTLSAWELKIYRRRDDI